jgi:hypothetical protein
MRFRLSAGEVALVVDARAGARVVEYSLAGANVLTTREVHPENHGSTFWTSPQSAWDWPPPAEIDVEAYRAAVIGERAVFEGAPSRLLGIAVTKAFSMSDTGAVSIEYMMTNRGTTSIAVAPWEVTRVAQEGVTFFPSSHRAQPPGARPPVAHSEIDGIVWVAHERPVAQDQKLYAGGSRGWVAHAAAGRLFVKAFPPVKSSPVAPGEAEIEIFSNQHPHYVELEQQGALTTLAPGDGASWAVAWHLVALPEGLVPRAGAPELVAAVEAVLGATRPP